MAFEEQERSLFGSGTLNPSRPAAEADSSSGRREVWVGDLPGRVQFHCPEAQLVLLDDGRLVLFRYGPLVARRIEIFDPRPRDGNGPRTLEGVL